jgi:hypothetical protein
MAVHIGYCYYINASKMLVCILDDFICITIGFLGFSGYLFAETFELIFVHDHIPAIKLTGSSCSKEILNAMLPPVCTVTNPQKQSKQLCRQNNLARR